MPKCCSTSAALFRANRSACESKARSASLAASGSVMLPRIVTAAATTSLSHAPVASVSAAIPSRGRASARMRNAAIRFQRDVRPGHSAAGEAQAAFPREPRADGQFVDRAAGERIILDPNTGRLVRCTLAVKSILSTGGCPTVPCSGGA